MSKLLHVLALAFFLLPSTVLAADVFKCQYPDGKIGYTGQPALDPAIKCERIFVRKPSVTIGTNKNSDGEDKSATTKSDVTGQSNAEKLAAQKLEEMKKRNCNIAKANLRTYEAGGRINRVNEDGESEILDSAAIEEEIKQAQKDVDAWC